MSEIIERGGQPGEQDISAAKLPKLPSGPGPGEPKITVTRATGLIPVSVELADDGRLGKLLLAAIRDHVRGPKPPPPPDPGPHPVYVRLLDAAEPNSAIKELVELHKARPSFVRQDGSAGWWECEGDEFGGYDGERPEWPCETVGIIAKHLGVSLEGQ